MELIDTIEVKYKGTDTNVIINKVDFDSAIYEKINVFNGTLRDAVLELIPSDDSHWRADGKPSSRAVQSIYGPSATQEKIQEVASDVTRETIRQILDNESGSR